MPPECRRRMTLYMVTSLAFMKPTVSLSKATRRSWSLARMEGVRWNVCRKALIFVMEATMSPGSIVLSALGAIAMLFGLIRFGDWLIVRLKLNKDRTTLVLAWALYFSLLTNLGVLGPLAFSRLP